MGKNKQQVPRLRFPGFNDAWEQRKLNEISQKVTEKNVNNIYQETFTNSAEFGIINQRDFFDKDISNKANLAGYYVVQNNDFVYNPRISNFAPVGPIKRNKLGRNGVMSPLYYVFRVDSVDYQFLETYFENTQWHIFMKENGDNGARSDRFAIKDSVFSTMPILLPSQQEQTAIGDFFRQLDAAIASHQRKLERVKELKKSLLQKMFPKDGEAFPELRFPNFTDAWEQRKLGELYKKNTERNELKFPIEKTISIAKMVFNPEGNGALSESLVNYRVLRVGDIAFEGHKNKDFLFGRFVLNDVGNGIMSPRFSSLRPIEYLNISFWKQYIHYEPIMRGILKNSTKLGTMMNELVIDDFLKQPIDVPTLKEQTAIGDFFRQLDAAIASHQRKLEHMQTLKKGLLQQMFV